MANQPLLSFLASSTLSLSLSSFSLSLDPSICLTNPSTVMYELADEGNAIRSQSIGGFTMTSVYVSRVRISLIIFEQLIYKYKTCSSVWNNDSQSVLKDSNHEDKRRDSVVSFCLLLSVDLFYIWKLFTQDSSAKSVWSGQCKQGMYFKSWRQKTMVRVAVMGRMQHVMILLPWWSGLAGLGWWCRRRRLDSRVVSSTRRHSYIKLDLSPKISLKPTTIRTTFCSLRTSFHVSGSADWSLRCVARLCRHGMRRW